MPDQLAIPRVSPTRFRNPPNECLTLSIRCKLIAKGILSGIIRDLVLVPSQTSYHQHRPARISLFETSISKEAALSKVAATAKGDLVEEENLLIEHTV